MTPNTLYYGDNLPVMRGHLADASVDLVYLDPPFNSQRNYNVLFKEQSGDPSPAQVQAFTDAWRWSERAYDDFVQECAHPPLVELVRGFVNTLGRNFVTAYAVMMAPRLAELHRVLKPTGSLYLHCDPTVSHYLRLVLDTLFSPRHFRSEIVWRRTNAHNKTRYQYGPIHDTLLFYSKSAQFTFHPGFRPYTRAYIADRFGITDGRGRHQTNYLTGSGVRHGESGMPWGGFDPTSAGRHWAIPGSLRGFLPNNGAGMSSHQMLDHLLAQDLIVFPSKAGGQPMYRQYIGPGVPYQDIWAYQPNTRGVLHDSEECIDEDVKYLENEDEKLGFDTQKPLGLLRRIIQTSSDPGDTVLDPFCGCGTTVQAAQELGRAWIGIDITSIAVGLIKARLFDAHELRPKVDYAVVGEPTHETEARKLAEDDRYEFQKWAVGLVPRARPHQDKKGADRGIDGLLYFKDDTKDAKKVVIQVKSGHVSLTLARDFAHVVARENATLGLFITLDQPTGPMKAEADALGFYTTPLGNIRIPRFQFRTVAQLLAGEGFHVPSAALLMGVSTAPRNTPDAGQEDMDLDA